MISKMLVSVSVSVFVVALAVGDDGAAETSGEVLMRRMKKTKNKGLKSEKKEEEGKKEKKKKKTKKKKKKKRKGSPSVRAMLSKIIQICCLKRSECCKSPRNSCHLCWSCFNKL